MAERHDVVSNPYTATLIRIKARQLCRRTDFSKSDFDDLRQEMLIYLLEKAHLFDPIRGNIEAFVTTVIKSWVGMELRRRDRLKRRAGHHASSLERTPIESDGDATTLGAVLRDSDLHRRTHANRADPIEQIDLGEAVARAVGNLTPNERSLLAHVAEHGVASTARERRVSRRQINNAIARMRARFEDAGLGAA